LKGAIALFVVRAIALFCTADEGVKPLIRAHYHASQAGDLDAASAIISEVYEYLRQWNCAELVCANLQLPLLTEVKNISL